MHRSPFDAGWVYIAASHSIGPGRYKVGLSHKPGDRREWLNRDCYGGAADWYMAHYRPVSCMRAVEKLLHECFGQPVHVTEHGGETEIFEVPYHKAVGYLNLFAERFAPAYPVGRPF